MFKLEITPMESLAIQRAFRRARLKVEEWQALNKEYDLGKINQWYSDDMAEMAKIDQKIEAAWDAIIGVKNDTAA